MEIKGEIKATKLTNLSAPSANGDSIRATTKITEINLESAVDHKDLTNDPHSVTKTQVGLSNVVNILNKLDGTQAPTANDDSVDGYAVGSRWIDITNDKEYVCLDATEGVAVWTETTGGEQDFLSKWNTWQFLILDDNKLWWQVRAGSVTQTRGTTELTTGIWYFVVGTYNGSTQKVYLDAIEEGSIGKTGNQVLNNVGVTIGSGPVPTFFFNGFMDDVRIYNRALSLPEIQSIYHSRGADNIVNGLVGRWLMNEKSDGVAASGANSCIDISGNGNHGTPNNSPIYRATPMKLIKPKMII